MRNVSTRSAQVAVVGAGLSGLAAAHRLVERGTESVIVVEAAERVGGRVWNRPLRSGVIIEGGAMYVCATQRDIGRLIEKFGLELFAMYADGHQIVELDGARHVVAGGGLRLDRVTYDELRSGLRTFDEWASDVPIDAPWLHPDAASLDAISLARWRDQTIGHPVARTQFDRAATAWLATPADRVSLLGALHIMATCGGLDAMIADQAARYRFRGGSQRLATAIAASLGDRVILGAPVRAIADDSAGPVRVVTPHFDVTADRVVLALNASGSRSIDFPGGLGSGRHALTRGWQPGHLIKVNVVYPEPFWRTAGLSGSSSSDVGPFAATIDSSPPDGAIGILTLIGLAAENHSGTGTTVFCTDASTRRRAALDQLARAFGPRALEPLEYQENNWMQQPWSYGCQGVLRPGAVTEVGSAWRAPVGRIHFAGTETADRWIGWMNGAVQAGERAADEVLATLTQGSARG